MTEEISCSNCTKFDECEAKYYVLAINCSSHQRKVEKPLDKKNDSV